ncbi:MAG: SPOR domain-containing protein [Betaproteobacteria bacterium]|nr:SPOR domain-containing protein [Betaproteobacteria bacterium]
MPTELDSDQVFAPRASGADPMAEHKQKARWRFFGAVGYCILVGALALQVLRDKPRPLSQDFVVLMPVPMSDPPADPNASPDVAPTAAPAATPAATPAAAPAATPSDSAPTPPAAVATEPASATPAADSYFVQLGAYSTRPAADAVCRRMQSSGHRCLISSVGAGVSVLYRVRLGPMAKGEAEAVRARAGLQGYQASVVQ